MTVAFEPSHPPFWCQTLSPSFFHHNHDIPSSPVLQTFIVPLMPPSRGQRSSPELFSTRAKQPPRPPNAWILYRSAKLKELAERHLTQAANSKLISEWWKVETREVRAHFERLSEEKKVEHYLRYPNYRFHPMSKAEKERLKSERLAEKERLRAARNSKGKARANTAQDPPPLFTSQARLGPAGPPPPTSVASPPHAGPSGSGPPLTPSTNEATPSYCPPSTVTPPSSNPSPYPPSPSAASIPPLVAPQPSVPQRPPSASDWQPPPQYLLQFAGDDQYNNVWFDQTAFSNMGQPAAIQQQYVLVPVPVNRFAPQSPLGWSPNDPSPPSDTSFYNDDRLMNPTPHPGVYSLNMKEPDEIFNGSNQIRLAMGTVPKPVGDLSTLSNLLESLDCSQFSNLDPSTFASNSTQQTQLDDVATAFDSTQGSATASSAIDNILSYSFGDYVNEEGFSDVFVEGLFEQDGFREEDFVLATPESQPAAAPAALPYIPPGGASNSSIRRRVAADWRHIQVTPESEAMV